jgi:hypothetical protein
MTVGRIRILQKIGQGGMGQVWLGHDELLGRDVAVKVLAGAAQDPNDPASTAFLQGARAAASLAHPGLNTIFDAGLLDGVPYLVLELLDGHDLSEIVRRLGPLELPAARTVITAVTTAVAELHHRDLVHRDIKPSNVILTAAGGVVLTDFGLARAQPALAIRADGGPVAGSPQYMAPEMFNGAVSARTDVYAIALTACYLLSGRESFEGSLEEIKRQQHNGLDTQPLRSAGVPQPVVDVILRATNPDALFRPKTARHLLELFENAFESAGIACASGVELVRLVNASAARPTSEGSPLRALRTVGLRDVITEFTAQRRDRKASPLTARDERASAGRPMESRQVRQRLTERRRARLAMAVASVFGAVLGILILAALTHAVPRWTLWLNGKVGQTTAAVFAAAVDISAIAIGCVGASALFYRLLRGAPLPELTEHTRCGWCRHELRGISQPVCPECGHTIGDRGPDKDGQMPPGYRARLMLPVLILAFFPAAVVFVAIPAGIFVYLLVPGGTLTGRVPTFAVLLLSIAATLTFYEAFLQFILAHTGRCWCSACGHELRNLQEPVCPACAHRI